MKSALPAVIAAAPPKKSLRDDFRLPLRLEFLLTFFPSLMDAPLFSDAGLIRVDHRPEPDRSQGSCLDY